MPSQDAQLDELFKGLSYYRRHKLNECNDACRKILENNHSNQDVWCLKFRVLSQQLYVEEFEMIDEGIADVLLDENSIAQVARPGTSLKTPMKTAGGTSQGYRPMTKSSRPLSGMILPGSQCGRPGTMEQAMRARTASTARPLTNSSVRPNFGLETGLPNFDELFVHLSRMNLSKYAAIPNLAKPLFEYMYYSGNDVRQALDLAAQATQACQYKDWWWKLQLGKCYYRLGMYRDAERQFKSSIQQQNEIDTYLWLGKVYIRLDQPLTALEVYKHGMESFPDETILTIHVARVYEMLNDLELAVKYYKDILCHDAIDVEAIACIATHHFYADQPEIAVRFYRRLLQMGISNAELYNNLALCCFYSQQYDMAVMCFERALALSTEDIFADIWYNIAHLSSGSGDKNLASQCYKLSLVKNNDHAESYNNLGVIECTKSSSHQAEAFFSSAANVADHLFEPHYNQSLIANQIGDLQSVFYLVKKALQIYPSHVDSCALAEKIDKSFMCL